MLGEPRIGLKPLAAVCRRLAISLGAGVDVRTVFNREAKSARGPGHRSFAEISEAVAAGGSISDGFGAHGGYFPEFFRQMVHVGETTGHLPEIFRQLADHYEYQLKLRRTLVSSITWPLIELGLALSVIGLLIWLMGMIPQLKGNDMLGLGLQGTSGLVKYAGFLALVAVIGLLIHRATGARHVVGGAVAAAGDARPAVGPARSKPWPSPAWLGPCTSRSTPAWKSARRSSCRSRARRTSITRSTSTRSCATSPRDAKSTKHCAIPARFRSIFSTPCRWARRAAISSSRWGKLADQYQDQAKLAMNTMTILLGVAITGLIAAIIIYFIYQIFSRAYMAPINDALKMRH